MAPRSRLALLAFSLVPAMALGCRDQAESGKDPAPSQSRAPASESAPADGPCDTAALTSAAQALEKKAAAWSPATGTMPDFSFDAIKAVWQHCDELPDEAKRLLAASVDPRIMSSRADLAAARGRPAPAVDDDPLDAELPGHAQFRRSDEAATKAAWAWRARLCPDYADIARKAGAVAASERPELFWKGCLDRFDLMTRDEYLGIRGGANVGFALYQWLTEGGVEAAVAKPLGRAVELGQHWLMQGRDPKLRLPAAPVEARVDDGLIVSIGADGVELGGRRVASVDPSGRIETMPSPAGEPLVPMLVDGLAEEREHLEALAERRGEGVELPVLILVDRSLPWSTLGPVVLSAHAAGFGHIGLLGLAADPVDPLRVVTIHDDEAEGPPLALSETTTAQDLVDAVVARGQPVRVRPR